MKEFLTKYGMIVGSFLVAFYTPIIPLLVIMGIICFLDMITAYLRDTKRYRKVQQIQSSKLRKTSIKTFAYLVMLASVYAIFFHSFGNDIARYATQFTFFTFASNELFSIGENLNLITGDTIFLSTIRNVVKKGTEWMNSKLEDKTKNKEEI